MGFISKHMEYDENAVGFRCPVTNEPIIYEEEMILNYEAIFCFHQLAEEFEKCTPEVKNKFDELSKQVYDYSEIFQEISKLFKLDVYELIDSPDDITYLGFKKS